MSDLRKVKAGDPLQIPASTYNLFVDAAADFQRRQRDQGSADQPIAPALCVIPLKNNSGADVARFAVLGIDSPIFSPTDNLTSFQNHPALVGVTPANPTHLGKFAICLEPIAAGKIGQAAVAGVCPVQVNIQTAGDGFADITDGDSSSLTSGSSGAATILWADSGTGVQWAIVRFGGGGGGGLAWGKATADWSISSSTTITLNPCNQDGSNVDTTTTITGRLVSGSGNVPYCGVRAGDVVGYIPFGTNQGLVQNVAWLPSGGSQSQGLYFDATGKLAVGYLLAH